MEKSEKMTFLLLLFSLIWKCIQMQPFKNSIGQGHLVTLAKGPCQLSVNIFKGLLL